MNGSDKNRHTIIRGVHRDVYILSISRFFEDFGSGMLITLLPLYIIDLHTTILPDLPLAVKAGFVLAVFGIFMTISQPIMGNMSDKLNRRKPFVIAGLIGYILLSLAYAYAADYEQLLLIRMIQGITVGATIPAVMAMVVYHSAHRTRGRTIGVYSTIRGLGFGVGPGFGGAIAYYYGFAAGFYACALFGMVSLVLVSLFVRETPSGPSTPETDDTDCRKDDADDGVPRTVLILAGAMFIMMLGIMMIVALLPEYMERLSTDEFMLGISVSVFMLTRLIFQIPVGMLSDRIGRKKLIVCGLITTAPLILGLAYVTTVYQLIALRALQGLTAAAIDTPVMALTADLSTDRAVARTMSTITTAYGGGMAIGPIFGGMLAGYLSFETPFYLCAILMLVAGAIIVRSVREPDRGV